jgi:hypothetical protein
MRQGCSLLSLFWDYTDYLGITQILFGITQILKGLHRLFLDYTDFIGDYTDFKRIFHRLFCFLKAFKRATPLHRFLFFIRTSAHLSNFSSAHSHIRTSFNFSFAHLHIRISAHLFTSQAAHRVCHGSFYSLKT